MIMHISDGPANGLKLVVILIHNHVRITEHYIHCVKSFWKVFQTGEVQMYSPAGISWSLSTTHSLQILA